MALAQALVFYLAALLLLQALAAAWATGAGPLHRHRPGSSTWASTGLLQHVHAHTSAQRHDHSATDASVQPDAAEQEAAETARLALTAALSLMATQTPRALPDNRKHTLPVALPCFWCNHLPLPLDRPPSQA